MAMSRAPIFLSTFPLRGTSGAYNGPALINNISIHVPLAGNVPIVAGFAAIIEKFLSTFPLRGTSGLIADALNFI